MSERTRRASPPRAMLPWALGPGVAPGICEGICLLTRQAPRRHQQTAVRPYPPRVAERSAYSLAKDHGSQRVAHQVVEPRRLTRQRQTECAAERRAKDGSKKHDGFCFSTEKENSYRDKKPAGFLSTGRATAHHFSRIEVCRVPRTGLEPAH